ncbi:transcriptional regulator [marine bacterium AO1-C]|nr:transcriptional regulator [marine bacterium AO1-C]
MQDYTFIKTGKKIVKLKFAQIVVIKGLSNYVQIFTNDDQINTIYASLKHLIEKLPDEFMRVHNSYIVNLHHIDAIEDNHIHLGEHKIPISANNRECVARRVNQNML